LPGVIIFSIPIILASLFAGSGKIMVNLYNTLFSFAVCLILDIVMIRPWSAEGASVASVITYVLSSIFSLYVASKLFRLDIRDIFVIKKEDYLFIKSKFIK
jgi:O-antigen/teichoic acid export membrane protein